MIKVSIIVPVYNVEEYLNKCLDSLVNQTLEGIEIIIINDGSTDNSYEICKKYYDKYRDKVVLITKKNEGQAVARNVAIDKANGEYLMFVDSDDYIEKNMTTKMYNKAKELNADIVWSLITNVKDDNYKLQEINIDNLDEKKDFILNNAGPCAKLIKKELIVNNKLYFPKIRAYEDVAIVPTWGLFAKKICFMNEGFYYYIIHKGSTMNQIKYNKKMEDIFYAFDYLYKPFNKKNIYKNEIEWIFIDHLLHAAALRFFQFENYKNNIDRISKIIKENFPNWRKNKYYQKQAIKYKIVCSLFYKKKYWLLNIILKKQNNK